MSELFEMNFKLEHIDVECDENQKRNVVIRHNFTSTSSVTMHEKLSAFLEVQFLYFGTFNFTDNAASNLNRNQLDNERLESCIRVETFETYPNINILVTDKR